MKTDRCWLQTYTGRAFYPLDPDPDSIVIEDIAHALSLQCRFTGHVRTFYSVGEHSVRLSLIVPMADRLWGLMHDASEAYMVDLARPIKRHSELGTIYKQIEAGLMRAICQRFGLPPQEPASIEQADRTMLVTEKRDLLGPEPRPWTHQDEPLADQIHPWTSAAAESCFLDRFIRLGGRP